MTPHTDPARMPRLLAGLLGWSAAGLLVAATTSPASANPIPAPGAAPVFSPEDDDYTVDARALNAVSPGMSDYLGYTLGQRLSTYALLWGMSDDERLVENAWSELQKIAGIAGITARKLPERDRRDGFDAAASAEAVHYLIGRDNETIGDLSRRFGPKPTAFAELAIKLHVAMLMYLPTERDLAASYVSVFERLQKRLSLPEPLFSDVIGSLEALRPAPDVRKKLEACHKAVGARLRSKLQKPRSSRPTTRPSTGR